MPLLLISVASALALAPPSASSTRQDGFNIRIAKPHELARVAQLQLDIFAPPPEMPPLLPMLQNLYEANQ